MPTSLFDDPPRHAPPSPPPHRPEVAEEPPLPPRRPGLPLPLVLAALLSSGLTVGLLALTGAFGGSDTSSPASVAAPVATTPIARGALNARALYTSAAPGVVDITARGVSTDTRSTSPFGGPSQQSQATATGTGFVVDKAGNIVTAAHVVDGASSISLTFHDGTTRSAKLLGLDDATDVAVIKVDPSGLKLQPLSLGRSSSLGVGDEVAAIGDPFGYARSLSTGIVSGLDRTIKAPNGFTVAHAIQTDAALNPGNSGGPVLNASGQVIGIADQIATGGTDANSGVGFATPIDLVSSELRKLEGGQDVRHAYLGVATATAADTAGQGAAVGTVSPGGPADDAGLQAGDVVTKLDGTSIKTSGELVAALAAHQPGDRVKLEVRRGGGTTAVEVTLGDQPAHS